MHETHGRRTMTLVLMLVTCLGMALASPWASAADSSREMRWQFSFPISFTSGSSYDGSDGTSIDVSDDVGFGVGFGYNLSEKLFLGVDFTWLNANYDAFIPSDFDGDQVADDSVELAGTLEATNLQFVGQYNFLDRRITPFVRGSFGWTWVDSNIPSGPTEGVCWWDPWWGYVCDTWQPTYSDTSFAYGLGAGVHFDVTDKVFIEGSYNILWIDFDKAGKTDFDGLRLNFGWFF